MKLTKAAVERAWKARGTRVRYCGTSRPGGFALIVNAASAAWTFSYKPRGMDEHGRRWPSRHVKLGGLDTLDLDGARVAAGALKAKVAAGGDPAREQAAAIAALALRRRNDISVADAGALTLTWLQTAPSAKTGRLRSSGYLHDAKRYMARIAEVLGPQVPIDGAAWRNLEIYLEELPPAQRVQAKAIARAMVARTIKLGHLAVDPLAGRWPTARTTSRDRTPSPAEVARLLLAADALARSGHKPGIAPVWRDVLYVIALTGCRRGEAATMRIEHVDLGARIWRQPSVINKSRREHAIPLAQRRPKSLPGRSENGQRDLCSQVAWARRCRVGHACGLSSRPRPAFKGSRSMTAAGRLSPRSRTPALQTWPRSTGCSTMPQPPRRAV